MVNVLHIDLETYSEVDLKKCGSHVYWSHPSTKVLCAAFALNDKPVRSWDIREKHSLEDAIAQAVLDDGTGDDFEKMEWHAWNAGGFEMLHLDPAGTRLSSWRDTMIRAAYFGLPMSLDQAAKALNLDVLKDMSGHRLMLKMCKPDKDGSKWHERDPSLLDKLVAYCKQDVETERAVAEYLPPLPDSEQKLWQIDWQMMQQGMPIDTNEVVALKAHAQRSLDDLNSELRRIMGGSPTVNSTAQILTWVNAGLVTPMASLDKAAVAEALSSPLPSPAVRRVLEIRQEAAKSSVAKLTSMLNTAGSDERIRGLTQFYGASRTGRWAGRLVQVQNLPRPAKGIDVGNEITAMDSEPPGDYAPPGGHSTLSVISSCLRGLFTQPRGFVVGDFSQIEARVIAWLAGQQDILNVFAKGEDVYTYTANKLGSKDRQFGKVLVLACGFGMGGGKFLDTAATYGVTLGALQAQSAVKAWRDTNPNIVEFWKGLENGARSVLSGRSTMHSLAAGKIVLAMGRRKLAGCLLMKLPSGRVLVYRNARLVDDPDSDFPPAIYYDGVNQTTRKWEALSTYGGKLAENATQAVARDLLAGALDRMQTQVSLRPLVTIHDEIICEPTATLISDAGVKILQSCMTQAPPWAAGLPIAADCKVLTRYGK